jgi:branched-chain amino acid transport system permease protein
VSTIGHRLRLGGLGADSRVNSVVHAVFPIVAAVAILAVLPPLWLNGENAYTTGLVVHALVFAAYGVGFNLIFGSTNQLFLCVGALAGVGGYGTAILADHAGFPLAVSVVLATAIAAAVGGLLSYVAVRRSLTVIFTGIVTLVFSLSFGNLLLGQRDLTGGETGHILTGAAIDLGDRRIGGYYMFAGVVIGFLIVFRWLQLSHMGWAFRALKDDELAAELAGVDVSRYRVYAAVIGSAMIGLTGALFVYSAGYISPATYEFAQIDVQVLVLVAFGGLGLLLSPLIGAAVFAYLDYRLATSGQLREVYYGAFIITIFLFFRSGVIPTIGSAVRWLVLRRRRRQAQVSPETG